MKKCVLVLAVLAMSTSAWGFVIVGDFAGQAGLLYSSPCAPVCVMGVDSCQGAWSKQGQIGCLDWSCFASFGNHHVYGGPVWPSFTYAPR